MIDHLDNLLRQLLLAQIDEITTEAQVRFQPPDDDWRTFVGQQTNNVLNVYLFDLRENRKLRSNERIREIENGIVSEVPAPRRVDCHYLITAWSPATVTPAIEPTVDEHALIYKVAGALTNSEPLIPRKVYDPNPLPATFPQVIADAELPTVLLPAEGFPKYGEFWGAMGAGHRWRPAVYYIVTLPLILTRDISGPMVTTRIAEYRFSGSAEIAEVMIEIGGQVLSERAPLNVVTANDPITVVVPAGTGIRVTVIIGAKFKKGDIVTVNNVDRATVSQVAGNDLTLDGPLPGAVNGAVLRIADLIPAQTAIRLVSTSGLTAETNAVITGDDAGNPGTLVTERAFLSSVNPSDQFVTLSSIKQRAFTFNLQAANAPLLIPLDAIAGAWVSLEDGGGTTLQVTTTDAEGRFRFGGLSEGNYVLHVRVQGFPDKQQPIQVPSSTGEYDVRLV